MASVEEGETLYVVPQQRSFVWPTIKIGRTVTVPHVKTPLGEIIQPFVTMTNAMVDGSVGHHGFDRDSKNTPPKVVRVA